MSSVVPPTLPQQEQGQHVMKRGSFVSSEDFESLTCGAAPVLVGRLRSAADAGQQALKELATEVQDAAISRLGGKAGGGVEVAFGSAMGRSFYATADESTTTADVVLFFTLVSWKHNLPFSDDAQQIYPGARTVRGNSSFVLAKACDIFQHVCSTTR